MQETLEMPKYGVAFLLFFLVMFNIDRILNLSLQMIRDGTRFINQHATYLISFF
jgi:hypothetical protein